MKTIYKHIERLFEKLVSAGIAVLGNSISFIVALCVVIFWLSNKMFYMQDIHYCIGDVILGVTFLSLFIIQKSFNRFSAALHIKISELLASHDPARNSVINVQEKSEREIMELSKEYRDLAEKGKAEEEARLHDR